MKKILLLSLLATSYACAADAANVTTPYALGILSGTITGIAVARTSFFVGERLTNWHGKTALLECATGGMFASCLANAIVSEITDKLREPLYMINEQGERVVRPEESQKFLTRFLIQLYCISSYARSATFCLTLGGFCGCLIEWFISI